MSGLTQGNLDRVLDRNIMTLFPGIHVAFLVVAVSKIRRITNLSAMTGVSPVTTFFMINMALLLYFVLVLDGVALLQGRIKFSQDILWVV